MAYISGENRYQITYNMRSLDEQIDDDCEVRVIDAYIEAIDIAELGFKIYEEDKKGQRPYDTRDLLKIHLYGYVNGIRSSRKLEKECKRNIEMMWLVNSLQPDHSTIAGFLKNNTKAIKQLFKQFVLFLKNLIIIDGELIAIDGTKIRANNSKKNHLNSSKIKQKIQYYEHQIEEYIEATTKENKSDYKSKIKDYQSRIEEIKNIQNEMKKEGLTQICQTDSDAKSMKNNNGYEPCYNMQSAVDQKNKIIVAVDVVSEVNDQSQLHNMLNKAKSNLGIEKTVAVADTGYFNQVEIKKVDDENDILYIKKQKQSNKSGSSNGYVKDDFLYDEVNDIYKCPEGSLLHFECKTSDKGLKYKRYKCNDCNKCTKKSLCTKSASGRTISRWEHEEIIEKVSRTTLENDDVYRQRQCIVEHPFGTIKRNLGYTYFLRKGLEQVQAEASLICLAYNLKRAINILGVGGLIHRIEG